MENLASHHKKHIPHYYLFIAVIAAIAGILFGYDTGVISGAILFINQEFHLSPQLNGFVVSAVLLGALMGAVFSGRLADIFGRKHLLIFAAIVFAIGALGASLAPTVAWLVISRIIVGIAIGIASYVGPMYIAEISPTKYRGALVSLNQLAITIGIFVSYIVDYFLAKHGAWRWMFGVGIIPAIILLLGMLLLPYSPRWVLSRGDEKLALAILNRIHGYGPESQLAFENIKKSLAQQTGTWKMVFSRTIWPCLIIACGLAFIQQVTGINTILYYAPTIFRMAGYHAADTAIFATMIVGAILVISTIVALPLIDTMGRRPLLFIGLILMTISLGALSGSFYYHSETYILKWFALASMMVFIVGFSISLGPIMWLMISEVFPLKIRGLGSSLATCVNWGSNWLVTITFLTIVQFLGLSGAFFIYFIISIISLLFIYYFVPETKGVSLEKIEENLYAGKEPRHLGDH